MTIRLALTAAIAGFLCSGISPGLARISDTKQVQAAEKVRKLFSKRDWQHLAAICDPGAKLVTSEQEYGHDVDDALSYRVVAYDLVPVLRHAKEQEAVLRQVSEAFAASSGSVPEFQSGGFRELPYPGRGVVCKVASNEHWKVVFDSSGKLLGVYIGWH